MKDHGLMFTDDMMRAILAGRKTQTRRNLREQPPHRANYLGSYRFCLGDHERAEDCSVDMVVRSPYGLPGDRIWCREAWAALDDDYKIVPQPDDLRAGPWKNRAYRADHHDPKGDGPANPMRWRPSLLMPRWAARIILEITDVRVQRLQDISEEDAIAEGAHWQDFGRDSLGYPLPGWSMHDPHPNNRDYCLGKARLAFGAYVNELADGPRWNLKPSNAWDRNSWVWAITFKRVES